MGTNNPKTSMFPIESVSGPFVRSSDLADHLFRLRLRGRKRRLLCHVFDPTRVAVALLGDEPEVKVAHFFHQGQVVDALDSRRNLDRRDESVKDRPEVCILSLSHVAEVQKVTTGLHNDGSST